MIFKETQREGQRETDLGALRATETEREAESVTERQRKADGGTGDRERQRDRERKEDRLDRQLAIEITS